MACAPIAARICKNKNKVQREEKEITIMEKEEDEEIGVGTKIFQCCGVFSQKKKQKAEY